MLGLKVNNIFLDLFPGEKISNDFKNNFFSNGIIKDSFSYSFKIPYSPKNQAVFGDVGNPRSTSDHQTEYDVDIFILFARWKKGLLKIEGAEFLEYYEIKIDYEFGEFSNLVGQKTLKQLFEGVTFEYATTNRIGVNFTIPDNHSDNTPYTENTQGNYPRTFFSFIPIAQGSEPSPVPFEYIHLVFYNDSIEQTLLDLEAQINAGDFFTATANGKSIDIGLKNSEYISRFQLNIITDFSASSNVVDRLELDTSFQHFAETMTGEETDFVFPMIHFPDLYDAKNPDFAGIINNYDGTKYLINDPFATEGSRNTTTFIPFLKLSTVFKKIEALSGYTIQGDFIEDSRYYPNLVIYNTFCLDKEGGTQFTFNVGESTIVYANHLPDIKVEELFEKLQSLCLMYSFDYQKKIIFINFRKFKLTQVIRQDFTYFGVLGKEATEKKKNLRLKYKDNLNDFDFFNPIEAGNFNEVQDLEIDFGTLNYDTTKNAISYEKGESELFGVNNKGSFRLLLWRGFQAGIPVAESKPRVGFNYGLEIQGTYGVYELLWKEYIDFLIKRKAVNAKFWLSLDELKGLDIEGKIKYDNINFLIEEAQFSLEDSENPLSGGLEALLWKSPNIRIAEQTGGPDPEPEPEPIQVNGLFLSPNQYVSFQQDHGFLQAFFNNKDRDPISNPLEFTILGSFQTWTTDQSAELFNNFSVVNFGAFTFLDGFGITQSATGFNFTLSKYIGGGGLAAVSVFFSYPFQLDTVYNYAVTYNGSRNASGVKLYINGLEVIDVALASSTLGNQSTNNSNPFRSGGNVNNPTWVPKAIGGGLYIYDQVLTPEEVAAHHTNILEPPAGFVRHYNFDQSAGLTVPEEVSASVVGNIIGQGVGNWLEFTEVIPSE